MNTDSGQLVVKFNHFAKGCLTIEFGFKLLKNNRKIFRVISFFSCNEFDKPSDVASELEKRLYCDLETNNIKFSKKQIDQLILEAVNEVKELHKQLITSPEYKRKQRLMKKMPFLFETENKKSD